MVAALAPVDIKPPEATVKVGPLAEVQVPPAV